MLQQGFFTKERQNIFEYNTNESDSTDGHFSKPGFLIHPIGLCDKTEGKVTWIDSHST